MVSHSSAESSRSIYHRSRRIAELLFSALMIPPFLLLTAIVTIAQTIESPGPIFFIQERIGKNGRSFRMVKFRTMPQDIDREAHMAFMRKFVRGQVLTKGGRKVYKPFTDDQVTIVGRLLRRTSLDEFPQLINVLRGEMSLVGPRPNVPWEVEEYKDWHKRRLEVFPGITGLAQIRGRSGISFDEIVRHDIEYIENQSITLDMKIMLWTVTSVLLRKGVL